MYTMHVSRKKTSSILGKLQTPFLFTILEQFQAKSGVTGEGRKQLRSQDRVPAAARRPGRKGVACDARWRANNFVNPWFRVHRVWHKHAQSLAMTCLSRLTESISQVASVEVTFSCTSFCQHSRRFYRVSIKNAWKITQRAQRNFRRPGGQEAFLSLLLIAPILCHYPCTNDEGFLSSESECSHFAWVNLWRMGKRGGEHDGKNSLWTTGHFVLLY